jgi:hypothetical protein
LWLAIELPSIWIFQGRGVHRTRFSFEKKGINNFKINIGVDYPVRRDHKTSNCYPPFLGITKEMMSRGPQVADMEAKVWIDL